MVTTVPAPQPVPVTSAGTSTLSEYTVTPALMTTFRLPLEQLQKAAVHSVNRLSLFLFALMVRSFVEQSLPVCVASQTIGPTDEVDASTRAPVELVEDWFLISPSTAPVEPLG